MRWLFAACGVLGLAFAQAPDPLIDAASAYVAAYQEQLTSVVADETYTQHVRAQVPRDNGMPPSRTTNSEIFFLHVPGFDWMAMRDVATVDGRPVTDRPDLKGALGRLAAPDVARDFKTFNSRYNLGRVFRNFNEPTLSLLVLDPRHRARFTFSRRRSARMNGAAVEVIGFRETRAPTLIRGLEGEPAYATGEFAVEPESGRIHRALLAVAIGPLRITLSTTYAEDAKLEMLVPVRFGEHYEDGTPPASRARTVAATERYEHVVCEAKYSNFRRFEVKAVVR
jgi:hypothetical protein